MTIMFFLQPWQNAHCDDFQVNRKEFKGLIPIVETSSHENINVDQAFFLGNKHDDDFDAERGNDHGGFYYDSVFSFFSLLFFFWPNLMLFEKMS